MHRAPLPVIDHPLVDSIHLYLKTNPHMQTTGAGVLLRSCAQTIGQAAKVMRDAVLLTQRQNDLIFNLRAEVEALKKLL